MLVTWDATFVDLALSFPQPSPKIVLCIFSKNWTRPSEILAPDSKGRGERRELEATQNWILGIKAILGWSTRSIYW
ncbi:hypothetical protein VNO77_22281 [Canavalia gladiata]|uniref:Uncharacterized protein n=1 Tax=Canavalia gladiata TaxID=3824 RepID=A0AAN9L2H3_CANGL